MSRPLQFAIGGLLFALLATANGAGYRYGVSDQAFYIPVVTHAVNPALFPRDSALIDTQGRLMIVDEVLSVGVRTTGVSLETLFLAGYLASLALIWTGVALIGTHVYTSPWAAAALGAAVTLRHRIPRTSANSLEPYFHPRMFAFGLGVLAIAALLRRRAWTAVALVAIAALVHPTTALWFAVLIGAALFVLDGLWRRLAIAGGGGAVAVLAGLVAAGPLRGALTIMDEPWLQAVASKDSLFASDWPLWAWTANFAFLGLLWWAHRTRVRKGHATPEERALVWGATALVVLFLVTLPFVLAKLSLAVQFQISRVFWLVEFVALVYVIAVVADVASLPRRAPVVAILLVALSVARGTYIMRIEQPNRALFERQIAPSPWDDAMRWMARAPRGAHILADPGHAWKYGTSVRVSARRDVFIEEVKDSALAIYSRDLAVRFTDRTTALGDFSALTAGRAQDLARRYDLDYLITENDLPLPEAYRNQQFRVYALR